MVLRKSFYIRWSAGRSPRVHEVNPGRDPSFVLSSETAGASGASVGIFSICPSCRISSSVCTYSSRISPRLGTRFEVSAIGNGRKVF